MEVRVSMPALLTMMSSRPKGLTAVPISISRSAILLTSALTAVDLVTEVPDLLFERSRSTLRCET